MPKTVLEQTLGFVPQGDAQGERLFETSELLNLIMNNTSFAISWKDLDLFYRGCNQRFAQMCGFDSPEAMIGKTDYEIPWGLTNKAWADDCRSSDARVIASGEGLMHSVDLIPQENGAVLWIETSKAPIRDPTGNIVGVLGVIEDITARKRLERTLEDANSKVEELSRIDSLTQIANRRSFSERLEQEWSRAQREGYELSIILFNIDHFRRFNDLYGQLVGDVCLEEAAFVAASVIRRSSDFIARYGGAEFIVLLPNAGVAGACAIAETLRQEVEALRIHVEDQVLSVTASFGVAVGIPTFGVMPNMLISKADEMLYRAKHNGHNCVIAGV
jgi:diguanylate cyclase (GGDEF)-like protein/PAS domain S-box-containing protein